MKINIFFLIIALFLFSCRNDIPQQDKLQSVTDTYVSGIENGKACYWKNGVKTELINGDQILGIKMFVQNNNVYVWGKSIYGTDCYWKNNVKYEVTQALNLQQNTPQIMFHKISGFTVDNDDVYFAGTVRTGTTSPVFELCYWKNGVKTVLKQITADEMHTFHEIIISNSDVYVTDSDQLGNHGYYKNGVYHALPSGQLLKGIAATSTEVVILVQNNGTDDYFYQNLTTGNTILSFTSNQNIYGIITDNNDLYSLNLIGNGYHKNGTLVNINFAPLYDEVIDMKVINNKKYMIISRDAAGISGTKVISDNIETQNITSHSDGFYGIFTVPN